MSKQKKYSEVRLAAFVSVVILATIVIWTMVKPKPVRYTKTEHELHQHSVPETTKSSSDDLNQPKVSLKNIIRNAKAWRPAYDLWFDETAPDFSLSDITDKKHRLSDYRGKNVLIAFWATWCGPCLMEIPYLITLRNTIGKDKLAMLAISNENPTLVKSFVTNRKINYTVLLNPGYMPKPYSLVNSIPSYFFIKPDGKIKLAAIGLMSLDEIKAVLQSE